MNLHLQLRKNIGKYFDQNNESLFGYKLGLWDLRTPDVVILQ